MYGPTPERFMQRCFDLAVLGAGRTAPNPMVGALLEYEGRIIGEGYHQAYGQAHAEVNAVDSVHPDDISLIPHSTLYVSLEPCDIYSKTPPCTRLILEKKIPQVVVSYIDHSPGVDGAGIQRLRNAGVEVSIGILRDKGRRLSQPRNTFVRQKRPYVILKYAQARNGVFAPPDNRQLWLSNAYTKRLTHRWRSEVDAILVGANTALADNPRLTNRYYFGSSPQRVVLDRDGSLPRRLSIFDGKAPTHVFTENEAGQSPEQHIHYHHLSFGDTQIVKALLATLAREAISILMVEGGIKTLQRFLEAGLWDEARVFLADRYAPHGRMAPLLPQPPVEIHPLGRDELLLFRNR